MSCKVERKQLQLVGVAAMFIASKYEEMYAPEIGDFVYITDRAYTEPQIREMEMKILATLSKFLTASRALAVLGSNFFARL